MAAPPGRSERDEADDQGERNRQRQTMPHRGADDTAGRVSTLPLTVNTILAFGATLVSLRLASDLVRRARARPSAELLAWAASLMAYATASAALAAGAAGGWHDATFRVYYLFGGLLTAPLLGIGSLLRAGFRRAAPLGLVYSGLALGVAIAMPLSRVVDGSGIPSAQNHLDLFPARVLAIAGNSLGTLAVVAVALATLRRRPLGNVLILAGVAVAALGSALTGLGEASTSAFFAVAAALLYGGVVITSRRASS